MRQNKLRQKWDRGQDRKLTRHKNKDRDHNDRDLDSARNRDRENTGNWKTATVIGTET